MEPISIFLDTSVLPRDARPSHTIDELAELVSSGLVRVYLSEIAAREWRSQLIATFQTTVRDLRTAVTSIMRHPWAESLQQHDQIRQLSESHESLVSEANAIALREYESVISKLAAVILPIDNSDGQIVIDHYFSGGPPFCNPKNRQDFPDAFIYCAARRLVATNRPLLCACKDKNLNSALQAIEGIEAFVDIKDLLGSEFAKPAIDQLEFSHVWKQQQEDVLRLLAEDDVSLAAMLTSILFEELPGKTIIDSSIPEDHNKAAIVDVFSIEELNIQWNDSFEYGPAWIGVPFTFESDVELEFLVHAINSFNVPSWVRVSIGDLDEDAYFEASAQRRIHATGTMSIRFSLVELSLKGAVCPDDVEIEDLGEIEFADRLDPEFDNPQRYDYD